MGDVCVRSKLVEGREGMRSRIGALLVVITLAVSARGAVFAAPEWDKDHTAAARPDNPAVAAQSDTAAESGYAYYYFKEARRLRLDTARVAVLRAPGGEGAVPPEPGLSRYGLDASAVEPMAVSGWSYVKTTASVRTNAAIEHAVSQVADREPVDFVSPVFLDDQGDPAVVTATILVGFDRSLDPSRAEAILATSGAGTIIDRDWANMKRTY